MKYPLFKRVMDLFLAFVLFIALFPVAVIVAGIIFLIIDTNVLFVQKRVGKDEVIFNIYKFKTMKDVYLNGRQLPDDKRLTKTGKFLRKFSLDELPQLINILKGEMSFIGPRPLLEEYLPYYTSSEKIRHLISPGITGLAQINGRNAISWDERLALDIEYVRRISFMLDLKILFWTFYKVIKGSDINAKGHVTMPMLSEERKSMFNE